MRRLICRRFRHDQREFFTELSTGARYAAIDASGARAGRAYAACSAGFTRPSNRWPMSTRPDLSTNCHAPRALVDRVRRPTQSRALEAFFAREWQRRGAFAWALTPLACVSARSPRSRRAMFALGWLANASSRRARRVVGNVTVGGTGKTPTVIALVEALRGGRLHAGRRVARLRRDRSRSRRPVTPASAAGPGRRRAAADRAPHAARRSGCARTAWPRAGAVRRAHRDVDVIVSDDGLQHYRLARDVELVVFDHRSAATAFCCRPARCASRCRAGATPRSSTTRTIARCRRGPNTFALRLAPGDAWHLDDPPAPAARAVRRRARAGRGRHRLARALLRDAARRGPGARHARAARSLCVSRQSVHRRTDADAILITEKDAVKLGAWRDARIWVVPVEAALDHSPHCFGCGETPWTLACLKSSSARSARARSLRPRSAGTDLPAPTSSPIRSATAFR